VARNRLRARSLALPATLISATALALMAVATASAVDLPAPNPGAPGVAEPRVVVPNGAEPSGPASRGAPAGAGQAVVRGADDTGRNARDGAENALTPMDQSNAPADLAITQQIRREVVRDGTLSTNAHNVKIITREGIVTLRGPVESVAEKETIARVAGQAPGVKRVDDQIEVDAGD
jgi:hypothetical protein